MKKSLIVYVVTELLTQFVKSLSLSDLRKFIDKSISSVEDTIMESENKYDDALLPGLRLLRELMSIPNGVRNDTDQLPS